MADIKPFPTTAADKPKPQRPDLNLVPFAQKDPNVIIARLERERTALEDRLADCAQVMAALQQCVAEWEAWAGVEPGTTPEPPAAS